MADAKKSTAQSTCPVQMSDVLPCRRPIHPAPPGVDKQPVCLMHSKDPNKDKERFRQEIDAILMSTLPSHKPDDKCDFTAFIFPESDFSEVNFVLDAVFQRAVFTNNAVFRGTTFTQDANFRQAEFTHEGDFFLGRFNQDADFYSATFTDNADFSAVIFFKDVHFSEVTFENGVKFNFTAFQSYADFSRAAFGPMEDTRDYVSCTTPRAAIANFKGAQFDQPTNGFFRQVNRDSPQGLRARFANSNLELIHFLDVHWYRKSGRVTLQDELDIREAIPEEQEILPETTFEMVAIAYRRLVNNFEKARNYDLAEDCFIGAMEMKRLDPRNFLFGHREAARKVYEKYRMVRKLGEWVSVANAYRLLSNYGSSYTRALGVLGIILLAFALLFPAVGLRMTANPELAELETNTVALCPKEAPISWCRAWTHEEPARELWGTFKAGLLAVAEVVTFQRRPAVEPATTWGKGLAIVEIIFIPGQLALLFLVLRRRFRR